MNRRHSPGPHSLGPNDPHWPVTLWLWLWLALATPAAANPSDICLAAARDAAASSGVPLSVLIAITQTETGRAQGGQTRPWPWTVNMEGEGQWFDTRDAAMSYVFEQYNRGARSFDIGCFQINFRWHGEQFDSIEEMFDPGTNAAYAARFLSQLYAESGNWSTAAGAFHSRTEAQAAGYRVTFDRFLQAAIAAGADVGSYDIGTAPILLAAAETDDGTGALPHVNSFPLLQSSTGNRALGSLVPLSP